MWRGWRFQSWWSLPLNHLICFCLFLFSSAMKKKKEKQKPKLSTLSPPNMKNLLIGKDPDTGENWRQEEKGMTEHEMVGWHHQLNGYEFEQALGDSEGQGSLACCSPRCCRVRCDWVTELNWNSFYTRIGFIAILLCIKIVSFVSMPNIHSFSLFKSYLRSGYLI